MHFGRREDFFVEVVFRRFYDDAIADGRRLGGFGIAFLFKPGVFCQVHRHRRAFGRFDFNMLRVNGGHCAKHVLSGAMGPGNRRNREQSDGKQERSDHGAG